MSLSVGWESDTSADHSYIGRLQLADLLLQRHGLGSGDDFILACTALAPSAHALPPIENQTKSDTMTAGYKEVVMPA